MKLFYGMFLAALLLISGGAQSEEFTARVIGVQDGDTVLVMRNGHPTKVRLAEIDAPEVGHAGIGGQTPNSQQPFGEASKNSLADMVNGREVQFSTQAVDQYGRLVARLKVAELDVNKEQIRRGMAWEYSYYHSNKSLVSLQQEARQNQRGLWAEPQSVQPSDWRKQHPNSMPKTTVETNHSAGCGAKKHCSEMQSCAEARHYLTHCGIKSLDGNGDGVPCESLCGSAK